MRSRSFWAVIVCVAWPSVAHAAVLIPLFQDRAIYGFAESNNPFGGYQSDEQSAAAPDFGPWNAQVQAIVPVASAHASQDSAIEAVGVHGSSVVSTSAGGDQGTNSGANATSDLWFMFRLTIPVTFSISGSLNASVTSFAPSEHADFLLSGPEGPIYTASAYVFNPSVTLNAAGALPPGIYSISAQAYSYNAGGGGIGSNSGNASWSFDVQFVPEPASLLLALGALSALRRR